MLYILAILFVLLAVKAHVVVRPGLFYPYVNFEIVPIWWVLWIQFSWSRQTRRIYITRNISWAWKVVEESDSHEILSAGNWLYRRTEDISYLHGATIRREYVFGELRRITVL